MAVARDGTAQVLYNAFFEDPVMWAALGLIGLAVAHRGAEEAVEVSLDLLCIPEGASTISLLASLRRPGEGPGAAPQEVEEGVVVKIEEQVVAGTAVEDIVGDPQLEADVKALVAEARPVLADARRALTRIVPPRQR